MDFMKPETVLDLGNIRDALVRMEDTIIFNFIERSQFYASPSVYKVNQFPIPNFDGSFLDWLLSQHERIHSQVRRYDAPDEVPFFPNVLEKTFLPKINYPSVLASYADEINVNNEILKIYTSEIVPGIAAGSGEQEDNLGSCAMADIECLQSLSRRIHFGRFVAEAKFISEGDKIVDLIKNRDVEGIEALITNAEVEKRILDRLLEKGRAYGTDPTLKFTQHIQSKVKPEVIVKIYKDFVIPLTKKVEVDYLLRRLEDEEDDDATQRSGGYVDRFLSSGLY
ncbi:hypothetical protein KL918_001476 [Ogataea parapolymorpha]|uniref:Chorismate mutase n=1 Tax=Ogataea parapolymorpha (strain ATCC 26012 / BCRC 20466 / JCM 22074 / NRRL Y-7560 / DL-1) TaxID=871575 RepID=W1QF05_OGAPD|nr:Chorismate mutase [Ogataea parapolymorpha DL-1]ESW99592.1 Chorismate mutase [Ogataea parapolymorpha DL-1]KAG7868833.1 hypothetical protein KL918_001476 [Ogataea parapolymorpha]KAG7870530.1 hypothetical protein KL916_004872 [Ogataea parapolymorpha]